METLLPLFLVGAIVVVIIARLFRQSPPTIIYVQTASMPPADQSSDMGCLPWVVGGFLLLVLLLLAQS